MERIKITFADVSNANKELTAVAEQYVNIATELRSISNQLYPSVASGGVGIDLNNQIGLAERLEYKTRKLFFAVENAVRLYSDTEEYLKMEADKI